MRSLTVILMCFALGCPQPAPQAKAPAPDGSSVSVEIGPDGAKVETKK